MQSKHNQLIACLLSAHAAGPFTCVYLWKYYFSRIMQEVSGFFVLIAL